MSAQGELRQILQHSRDKVLCSCCRGGLKVQTPKVKGFSMCLHFLNSELQQKFQVRKRVTGTFFKKKKKIPVISGKPVRVLNITMSVSIHA